MQSAAIRSMSADEFLQWSLEQDGRYEFVDGRPVPLGEWVEEAGRPRLMAGARRRHDKIVANLIRRLGEQLEGGPCRPYTADTATRTVYGDLRRPDVTVDCADLDDDALESGAPTVLFEVLSPTTRGIDLVRKSHEYQQLPSLRHLVLVEPQWLEVHVWSRAADGAWPRPTVHTDLDDAIDLAAVAVRIPLRQLYADVRLTPAPAG
jgi:Uma2 family endonuclease